MANIGFIGLGIMGAPMARHLQQAGHTVITSKHSTAPRRELVEGGLQVIDTPKAVAEAAAHARRKAARSVPEIALAARDMAKRER